MTDEPPESGAKSRTLVLHARPSTLVEARGGADGMIADLYARMCARMRAMAAREVGDHADDVVHDAFDRLWRYVVQYGTPMDAEAMLVVLVRHAVVEIRRREARQGRGAVKWLRQVVSHAPEAHVEGAEVREKIAQAVATLPPREREVWLLVNHQGYSFKKVAALVGIEPGAVRLAVSRANRRLRAAVIARGLAPGKDTP